MRRVNYATHPNPAGELMFTPEYAEIYGVPFSLMLKSSGKNRRQMVAVQHVKALTERKHLEITFPHVTGYKYELPDGELHATFNESHHLTLSTRDLPTWTNSATIFGVSKNMNMDKLKISRLKSLDYYLAKLVIERFFRTTMPHHPDSKGMSKGAKGKPVFDNRVQVWRFPEVLRFTRQWREECLICYDDTFPQLLFLIQPANDAAQRIYSGITYSQNSVKRIVPIMRTFEAIGTSADVDFDTSKDVYRTTKSHVDSVTLDSSWERIIAQHFERLDAVKAYVKNDRLGFRIPCTLGLKERYYEPDYIAKVIAHDGKPLNLIIEVSGKSRTDKDAKKNTVRNFWLPAINGLGEFGRWDFIEINNVDTAYQELQNYFTHGETRPMLIALKDKEVL